MKMSYFIYFCAKLTLSILFPFIVQSLFTSRLHYSEAVWDVRLGGDRPRIMARPRFKWLFSVFISLYLFNLSGSLPINPSSNLQTTDSPFINADDVLIVNNETAEENLVEDDDENVIMDPPSFNGTFANMPNFSLRNVRPGQEVRHYHVELTRNGGNFNGRLVADVQLSQATREDEIVFHVEDLNIQNVLVGVFTDANAVSTPFDVDDGLLEISPNQVASSYVVIIEYTFPVTNYGYGLFSGQFPEGDYIAMNLHPANARRVFPCMDEPTEATTISFTFHNLNYNHLVSNSMLVENSQIEFRPLQGPPHLWGMVAHNLQNINIPTTNVLLYGRASASNQDSQAAVAINNYYHALNEWTSKSYLEIVVDQTGSMNIIALPDISRDWYALSTVCIWEPYILMETVSSVKQRKKALVTIAEAMAKQWFGYVIYPENWRYQWVIAGLGTYAAYDIVRSFQTNSIGVDDSLLDMDTIFISDVMQESLYHDAYTNAQLMEPTSDIFDEEDIRYHVNGLVKYKAPAILWMLRNMLGGAGDDFIKTAARALINQRSLQTVNSLNFFDAINSEYLSSGTGLIDELDEFFEPWLFNTGYPLLHVGLRQGGVLITQERFGFSSLRQINYEVPVTYTTSVNPNFDDIYPTMLMDSTTTLNFFLDEEDWVLFNLQGQGYYRVNYDNELWERIIEALEDPDRRNVIHPMNRATLVDDALNLARSGKLDYEIAFEVVLTMENEIEYPVWKAFVRNMMFLKRNFDALVEDDEDLDPDIYLRMVRRTVGMVEQEIGFYPELNVNEPAMTSLTRGLVMEHACKSKYQPCVAAAVDWFYDPNNRGVVNPNIPSEIRPAVYCTMMREGDDDVITALYNRLEIEPSLYERVVILESLACSQDAGYIQMLLEETIANNSPYNTEERSKIFAAVASASNQNAQLALNFISMRTNEIRNTYGGPEKLEEAVFALAENMMGNDLANDFINWVNSIMNNLDDSGPIAEHARDRVMEDLRWYRERMDDAYEWIDENDAPTIFVSTILICISLLIALCNN